MINTDDLNNAFISSKYDTSHKNHDQTISKLYFTARYDNEELRMKCNSYMKNLHDSIQKI
jgi:hypothetical protein